MAYGISNCMTPNSNQANYYGVPTGRGRDIDYNTLMALQQLNPQVDVYSSSQPATYYMPEKGKGLGTVGILTLLTSVAALSYGAKKGMLGKTVKDFFDNATNWLKGAIKGTTKKNVPDNVSSSVNSGKTEVFEYNALTKAATKAEEAHKAVPAASTTTTGNVAV